MGVRERSLEDIEDDADDIKDADDIEDANDIWGGSDLDVSITS